MTTRITVPQPFAIASDDSRSMSLTSDRLTSDRPLAKREMILGSCPTSRSSGPAESGPACPPPREARGAAKGAQAVSTP
jgi:hypothetical protein